MHFGSSESNEGHGNVKSLLVRHCRLPEGDGSSQSRLESEVFAFSDMGIDELFELAVGGGADFLGDTTIKTAIELRGTVVRVEYIIDGEYGSRKDTGLPAARWSGDDEHAGKLTGDSLIRRSRYRIRGAYPREKACG